MSVVSFKIRMAIFRITPFIALVFCIACASGGDTTGMVDEDEPLIGNDVGNDVSTDVGNDITASNRITSR